MEPARPSLPLHGHGEARGYALGASQDATEAIAEVPYRHVLIEAAAQAKHEGPPSPTQMYATANPHPNIV